MRLSSVLKGRCVSNCFQMLQSLTRLTYFNEFGEEVWDSFSFRLFTFKFKIILFNVIIIKFLSCKSLNQKKHP